MRAARILALLAGLGVAAWLVWEVGPGVLGRELARLGWSFPLLLVPQVLVNVIDAAGWRYAFPGPLPRMAPLIPIRIVGEAVNATTPTATIGGDAVKAWLVERTGIRVPLPQGLVSVIVAKTALFSAQVVFVAVALVVAWRALDAPRPVIWLLAILTGAGLVGAGGFFWAQQRGLFRLGSRALSGLGAGWAAVAAAEQLDRDLRQYYQASPGRFLAASLFHLAGWVAGAGEVWLALALLGTPIPFATALVIEAGITGVRSASFLVPASIGVQEGGVVGIFVGLGLGAGSGLTVGLLRRLREALWAMLGYAVLAAWRGRPARPLA